FKHNNNKYYFTGKSNFEKELVQGQNFDSITNTLSINLVMAGDGSESLISNLYKKKITDLRSFGSEILKVSEDFQEMKWIDTSLKDSIMDYECQVYELDFRGRHYIAYVTSEIEERYNFGPWKFNGFDGVPLLIYDTEKKLEWEIVNIERLSDKELSEYASEIENRQQELREVNLQDFMYVYDRTNGGMTLTKGYPVLGPDFIEENPKEKFKRGGLELVFEWEDK
ncbi:MAG: GLPGLI family protein, partial [Bacteroidota bacterium]